MTQSNKFLTALLAGCVVVALGVWCSSGTLVPYGATLAQPHILKPCNYLANSDHVHFEATFLMLDGAPREQWEFSVMLRRILFPLIAYPLMKAFGFLVGGVITSAILQLAAFVTFIVYIRRKIGDAGAFAAIALFATYPGTYYWAGLPYCHAMIVPASLMGILLLWEIERDATLTRVAICSALLGVLFLAYDLLPLFGPPVVMILLCRRRFLAIPIAAALLLLPTVLDNFIFTKLVHLPLININTRTYIDIVHAYLHPTNFAEWRKLLLHVPHDAVRCFYFSNFWFLPWLFLFVVIVNYVTLQLKLLAAEKWLLATTALLFAFINLAPPTEGWQFRGSGMPRIYQPAFAAMLLFIARWMQDAYQTHGPLKRTITATVVACAFANVLVVFGPMLHVTLADHVYLSFYRHATAPMLSTNLDYFGRRPLGFCDMTITRQNVPSKHELKLQKLAHPKKPPPTKTQPLKKKPHPRTPATVPSAPSTAAAPSPGG